MKTSKLWICVWVIAGCSDVETTDEPVDAGATRDAGVEVAADAGVAPPLELTDDLCDDPANLAALMESLQSGGAGPTYGEINLAQVQRMVMAPTEGPFYMVNLIRFRAQAAYPDGRATDLTGEEANALYSPAEFLSAIGARPVFVGTVSGDDTWDQVAIVEYPCPLALFAMSAHPEFSARSVHKEAGVEASIVMVTHLLPLDDVEPVDPPFPSTPEDPAFARVQVLRLPEIADYADPDEPMRTGREALEVFTATAAAVDAELGIRPLARLTVQGVFIGDGRTWDDVRIDLVPSRAAFDARDVADVAHHREAALEEAYDLTVAPQIADFPGSEGVGGAPPVTADGTGTLCTSDADCPGNGVNKCLLGGGSTGFCTREGCAAGACQAPYVCCHDCSEAVASLLPFMESACFPESQTAMLTSAPVSCACD
ncbi:MAG: hypothetical protein RIT81_32620 [Deltaproteobacteria bacterium]